MKPFVVTIDGPAAAGKSTTARGVAARLGFLYLDTGALYRALALKVLENGVTADDPESVESCVRETRIDLSGSPGEPRVWLDDVDVTQGIRAPAVSEMASRLAAQPAVRRRLGELQRRIAQSGPAVAEGRDLGTVVFPKAEVKIYLDADLETRARRRHRELQSRGIPATLEQVREDLERRDARDRERDEAPLRTASDAVVVDTTGMDPQAQVDAVLAAVRAHPAFREPGAGPEANPAGRGAAPPNRESTGD
jgi:cytidylate kinase